MGKISFWDYLAHIADTLGILGFFVSLFLWLRVDQFAKEAEKQKISYAIQQKDIYDTLKGLKENIVIDGLKTHKIVSRIREEVYVIRVKFKRVFERDELKIVDNTIDILKSNGVNIDFEHLSKNLDLLLAILRKDV